MNFIWNTIRQTIQTPFLCKYINLCNKKRISNNAFLNDYFGGSSNPDLFYISSGYLGQLSDIFLNWLGFIIGSYGARYIY